MGSKNDPRNSQHNLGTPTTGHRQRTNGTSRHTQHSPGTPTTGLCGNDTSRSTGRSGRQKAATRCNKRREEWVTVQGPVKKPEPDEMSHGWVGGGGAAQWNKPYMVSAYIRPADSAG